MSGRRAGHRALRLAAVLLLLLVAPAPAVAGQPAAGPVASPVAAAPTPPCDWRNEFEAAIAALGEDRSQWAIRTDAPDTWWGTVYLGSDLAVVSRDAPCHAVGDVVRHEWMHLQQGRMHGTWSDVIAASGGEERAELVADCGSRLLGSQITPYIDKTIAARGVGCLPGDWMDALALIAHHPEVVGR